MLCEQVSPAWRGCIQVSLREDASKQTGFNSASSSTIPFTAAPSFAALDTLPDVPETRAKPPFSDKEHFILVSCYALVIFAAFLITLRVDPSRSFSFKLKAFLRTGNRSRTLNLLGSKTETVLLRPAKERRASSEVDGGRESSLQEAKSVAVLQPVDSRPMASLEDDASGPRRIEEVAVEIGVCVAGGQTICAGEDHVFLDCRSCSGVVVRWSEIQNLARPR